MVPRVVHDRTMRCRRKYYRSLPRLFVCVILSIQIESSLCFQHPQTLWHHRPSRIRSCRLIPMTTQERQSRGHSPSRRRTSAIKASSHASNAVTLLFSAWPPLLVLGASTCAGLVSEKHIAPSSGILTTLVTSALLSNTLRNVPSLHPLCDACWTLLLPASLVFLLLSLVTDANDKNASADAGSGSDMQSTQSTVQSVGISFLIGSIGSIIGCLASFILCSKIKCWMTPDQAATAAACLCASFIGGSVNFFATAHHVIAQNDQGQYASLLSSMAAADLVVMALYFMVLSIALRSKRLHSLFGTSTTAKVNHGDTLDSTSDNNWTVKGDTNPKEEQQVSSTGRTGTAILLVTTLAWAIVQTANQIQDKLAAFLPGTACAVICLMTSIAGCYTTKDMRRVAGPLSQVCFYLFFASIGVTANIGRVLQSGPVCLWFSVSAIIIHLIVIVGGSFAWNALSKARKVNLNHVLVASNAAIGGPATAAAFCGQIRSEEQRGLAVAATLWGVVGYAIGTTIGVRLYQLLCTTMR